MLPRTLAAAALLTSGLVGGLTGCGGSEDSSDTGAADDTSTSSTPTPSTTGTPSTSGSPSPSAAADGQLAGNGYTLVLPEGWRDATEQFQDYSPLIDTGAVDGSQAGEPFSDNVNVLRNADQAELPAEQAERQFADELGTVASGVRVRERATVDGVESLHLTGRTTAGEVVAVTDQYISHVDGAYYVITFSFDSGTPRAEREQDVDSVLASWSWG